MPRCAAPAIFFDSASPSGDHRSAAEVIPESVANLFAKARKQKMPSCRRQTAAVFFFDSASPFRGTPERSGGNPRKRCEFIRKREHRSAAEVIPEKSNSQNLPFLLSLKNKLKPNGYYFRIKQKLIHTLQ